MAWAEEQSGNVIDEELKTPGKINKRIGVRVATGELNVSNMLLEGASRDPVTPDDDEDEQSILDAVGTAIGNFLDWITGSDDSEDTPTTAAASFSNLTEPITWSTTTSYRSGSDTGNNIGFDSTSDDFYIKMSRDTSKMIIRNTDGELVEFGPFIKFYESIAVSYTHLRAH